MLDILKRNKLWKNNERLYLVKIDLQYQHSKMKRYFLNWMKITQNKISYRIQHLQVFYLVIRYFHL